MDKDGIFLDNSLNSIPPVKKTGQVVWLEVPFFFDQVKIKSPGAETAAKTAARLRLESYAEAEPLPRLLGNSRNVTKLADQRADKVMVWCCVGMARFENNLKNKSFWNRKHLDLSKPFRTLTKKRIFMVSLFF